MAKRFTDSEKWKKLWFSDLSPVHKCLWFYILDSCSTGGIWEVNWKLASFHVGAKLNPAEVMKIFKKQFHPLDSGRKWFIVDFIAFQYGGRLGQNNPAHRGAWEELQRYSLVAPDGSITLPINILKGASEELDSTLNGAMVTATDTVTATDKATALYGEFQNVTLTNEDRQTLTTRLGSDDRAVRAIEILSAYKKSSGKKYKSDYATFTSWVIGELEKREKVNGQAKPMLESGRRRL